jgi:UDP-3-O-[3-hydroxymyristoyl] glucosamine N-acyltransferase
MKLTEIAARIEGKLSGNGETEIRGIAALKEAQVGDITFLLSRSFEKFLPGCRASAYIVGQEADQAMLAGRNVIAVANPDLAQALTAELFEVPRTVEKGVSASAYVSPRAAVSDEASILPYVYIDDNAVVEANVVIYPFCFVGRDVFVGEDTVVYPNVSIYNGTVIGRRVIIHAGAVLGKDGFGYVWDGRRHKKKPQLGMLEIEDDVEIGANTCIDRATLQKTVVARGTKIDNLVQISHNVSVGENSVMAAQVGIAGSTSLGKNVVFGGKVGVADHVAVGDNVMAAGGTGITKSVKSNSIVAGNPHLAHRDWLKMQSYLRRLPDLFERVRKMEAKLSSEGEDDRDR